MAITLQESLRAVFYAPFYVALAKNAFAAEGVEVRFVSAPRPGDAALGLLNGTVDVCWGGPMRVMETYQLHPGCDLVSFAEVVTRDPFFLVGRGPRPGFSPADLTRLRLARVSEVPTPWMCLQEDARRAGADPDRIARAPDAAMAANAAALRDGQVDAAQLFEPFVSELLEDPAFAIWYAQADRGPTSYTTFYARRPTLIAKRGDLARMVRAIHRTQKWVATADGAAIAAAIASYFPDIPAPRLAAACARYKSLGIWGTTPILPREGYDRLRASLVSGRFVSPGTPFDVAVDNSLATQAVAENPPPLA
jgi:NitT/TauT family transport system substrate-binding protein